MQQRGTLIVFEGLDRCGKTSQIQLLNEKLRNRNVPLANFNFPNRTTHIGSILDSYLRCKSETEDHAIHLLFSANRWELRDKIVKHLEEGTNVILDRYAYSGVAFSASKGLDLEWCKNPDRGLPYPDLVVYLDISIEESMRRGEFGNERYEKKAFQETVAKKFEELKNESNWKIVDAAKSKESLNEELLELILSKIAESKSSEIGKLWL